MWTPAYLITRGYIPHILELVLSLLLGTKDAVNVAKHSGVKISEMIVDQFYANMYPLYLLVTKVLSIFTCLYDIDIWWQDGQRPQICQKVPSEAFRCTMLESTIHAIATV
jgi:hypothetical protein